jgi:hypothetical protein
MFHEFPLASGGRFVAIRPRESFGGVMSRNFHVVTERDSEGYYVASVPSLPGCHTQARSLDEINERIKGAILRVLP